MIYTDQGRKTKNNSFNFVKKCIRELTSKEIDDERYLKKFDEQTREKNV